MVKYTKQIHKIHKIASKLELIQGDLLNIAYIITWIKTIKEDLKVVSLSYTQAVRLANDRKEWHRVVHMSRVYMLNEMYTGMKIVLVSVSNIMTIIKYGSVQRSNSI